MPTLVITRGLPASGKTTKAREWVAADPVRRARVNRDDVRAQLHDSAHVVAAMTLCGLALHLGWVGLDRANPLAGVLSLFVAIAALLAPYLFPPPNPSAPASLRSGAPAPHDRQGGDTNQGFQYNESGGGVPHNTFN